MQRNQAYLSMLKMRANNTPLPLSDEKKKHQLYAILKFVRNIMDIQFLDAMIRGEKIFSASSLARKAGFRMKVQWSHEPLTDYV